MRIKTNRRVPAFLSRSGVLIVLVVLLLGAGRHELVASDDASRDRSGIERSPEWRLQTGFVLGANPTVFGVSTRAGYSIPLYRRHAQHSAHTGILWRTARIEPGVDILANPSFTDIAARIYIEPIAFFDLRVEVGARAYYTAFGYGLTPLSSYAEDLPAVTGADYDRRSEWGRFVRMAPRLKFQAGPAIATNTLTAAWYTYPDTDAAYLEESVTLRVIANTDRVYQNTTQLIYQFRNVKALFAGIGVDYTVAWVPSASRDGQPPLQRAALLGAYAHELSRRSVLQTALLAGGYPTGEPADSDRTYVLAVVTVAMRY